MQEALEVLGAVPVWFAPYLAMIRVGLLHNFFFSCVPFNQ